MDPRHKLGTNGIAERTHDAGDFAISMDAPDLRGEELTGVELARGSEPCRPGTQGDKRDPPAQIVSKDNLVQPY